MKTKLTYLLSLLIIITLLSFYPPPQGPHGGIVKKSENYYIEMKNDADTSFFAYLLNKKLKTVSNKGISGEIKLFFSDSTTLNAALKPTAENAFTARVAPGFYSCKITFLVFGKSISASFDKENQIVQKQ